VCVYATSREKRSTRSFFCNDTHNVCTSSIHDPSDLDSVIQDVCERSRKMNLQPRYRVNGNTEKLHTSESTGKTRQSTSPLLVASSNIKFYHGSHQKKTAQSNVSPCVDTFSTQKKSNSPNSHNGMFGLTIAVREPPTQLALIRHFVNLPRSA